MEKRNSYFITGATGFIGANLSLNLANSGHEVHALCRSETKAKMLSHQNIKIIQGDLMDSASLEMGMKNCAYVFHLAAFAKVWSKDPSMFTKINVEGTTNVLEAARKTNIQRVVVTSTAGIFGPSFGSPVHEQTERKIDFFNEYEETKWMAEEEVMRYVQEGMEIILVYPTRVYGPGQMSASNSVTKLIQMYAQGKWRFNPGNGKSVGNYVYIDDVISGHLLAMYSGAPGEKYILGGENASYNDLFDTLAQATGKKLSLFKIPLYLMWFFAWIQLMMAKLFGRPPLITPKWIRKYHYDTLVSSDKAIQQLNYKITSLKQGIEKTLQWLQKKS